MQKNKRALNINITDNDLHYIAGIIDGGSSFIMVAIDREKRPSRHWEAMIIISSCNVEIINYLNRTLFLGDSGTSKNKRMVDHRYIHRIRIAGPMLDILLPRIVPILIIKKQHALILERFRKTIIEKKYLIHRVSDEVEGTRQQLFLELNKLNSTK